MKTILFICVHNSGRSQMAEAFVNKFASGRVRAISAGTEPAEAVDPAVVKVMREVGIDIGQQRPKGLTPEMMVPANKVVMMGCGVEVACPVTLFGTEDWNIDDPKGKPVEKVRQIRDQIRTRVRELLATMPEEKRKAEAKRS